MMPPFYGVLVKRKEFFFRFSNLYCISNCKRKRGKSQSKDKEDMQEKQYNDY